MTMMTDMLQAAKQINPNARISTEEQRIRERISQIEALNVKRGESNCKATTAIDSRGYGEGRNMGD
jgi:hypothetical protein